MTDALQKLPAGMSSNVGDVFGPIKADEGVSKRFPAGLRVLVVDDDTTCLKILEQMLLKCEYHVTVSTRALSALSLLRGRKGHFDLVISDVHMPDMDGFKLLELVGLEMDLPVIMMSADSRTSMVMKGIKHGACDYLIKPVRFEELKNVWQHVVRKRQNENKDHEQSGSVEESDRVKRASDDAGCSSSANNGPDANWKTQKRKRDAKEHADDGDMESEDPSASKKPRVVWSVELHQQFVSAVNQLGVDKAVPKRILELMNVPGLTRENVASHLQKYRLYLKRLSGVTQHQGGPPSSFYGSMETSSLIDPRGSIDLRSLATSGQVLPQTLMALQADLLGRSMNSAAFPKLMPVDSGTPFGKPLLFDPQHCSSNQITAGTVASFGDVPSRSDAWAPAYPLTTDGINKCNLTSRPSSDSFEVGSVVNGVDCNPVHLPLTGSATVPRASMGLGFVGSGTYIPRRFAADEVEPLQVKKNIQKDSGDLDDVSWIKQEIFPDLIEDPHLAGF